MRIFRPQQRQTQTASSDLFYAVASAPGPSRREQARADERYAGVSTAQSRFGYDFSLVPTGAPGAASGTNLAIGAPGDPFEREAERVADQVGWRLEGYEETAQPLSSSAQQRRPGPRVVNEVLASPGRQLSAPARGAMEQRLGRDFGCVRIHTDSIAERASAALAAEAFTVGDHIAFARGRFQPGTAQGEHLIAHELTHTIQQAASSPYIARAPEKKAGAAAGLEGAVLGTKRNKDEVRIKRSVGASEGYNDRLKATAVARLAKADPAAVALSAGGMWYALETTAAFEAGRVDASEIASGGKVHFVEVHGLPPLAEIDSSRQKVDDEKAHLGRLDVLDQQWHTDPTYREQMGKSDPPLPEQIEQEKEQASKRLLQANQTRAKAIFGVSNDDVEFTASLSGRKAGKINIIGSPENKNSTGAAHAPLGGGTEFQAGLASAFSVDYPALDKPERAQSELFHEVQHLNDWDFAQAWVGNYQTEAKKIFVKEAPGPFQTWLNDQVKKKRLTKADVELIVMETQDQTAYSEARANVRTFLAAIQAGASDVGRDALVGYAHALKPKKQGGGGQYASPAPGSAVQAALVAELKAAHGKMPKTMQKHYDDAVAAAKAEFPDAWISELDFAKRGGK